MAYIGKTPTIGNFQVCDAISVVNGQAAYTMQVGGANVSPETANHMIVSLNGIIQAPGSSYTVSGSTITFASNLVTGDVINFIHILGSVLDLGVPSDSTVSLAKLTATGTKDATTFLRGDNTFATVSGGLVKLSETIVAGSSATSIDFTSSVITSTYDTYYFTINMHPETDNAHVRVLLSDGGSFNTGSTDYGWGYVNEGGTGFSSNGEAMIKLCDQVDTAEAGKTYSGTLTLLNPQNSSYQTNVIYHGNRDDGNHSMFIGGGLRTATEANDGIRFYFNTGNISVGSRVTCYGIVK